jgi:nucleoid-associated protein EbfC
MFNFKNLAGLSQLMMNAGNITERVKEMRASLAQEIAVGSAAEGSIQIEVTGTGEVQKLFICSSLIQDGSTNQLEELLPLALNEALAQVRQLHIDKVRELTGGIDLPGLDEALGGL